MARSKRVTNDVDLPSGVEQAQHGLLHADMGFAAGHDDLPLGEDPWRGIPAHGQRRNASCALATGRDRPAVRRAVGPRPLAFCSVKTTGTLTWAAMSRRRRAFLTTVSPWPMAGIRRDWKSTTSRVERVGSMVSIGTIPWSIGRSCRERIAPSGPARRRRTSGYGPVSKQQQQADRMGEAVYHQHIGRLPRRAENTSAASAIGRSAASRAAFNSSSQACPEPCGFMPPRNK